MGHDLFYAQDYMLNSLMLYDAHMECIKNGEAWESMTRYMNLYPISRTNEMAIMNLYFLEHRLWSPLPLPSPSRRLYAYANDTRMGELPQDFVALKYIAR